MSENKSYYKPIYTNDKDRQLNTIEQVKNRIIDAMIQSLGNVSEVCNKLNISRTTFYNYYNNDIDFRNEIDDIKNIALDFVESKLINKIKEGDTIAILFYLKTQGKKRGYIERQETELTIQQPVVIDWSEPIQEAEEVKAIEIKEENKEDTQESKGV